jgi:Concanavalin A-like lectin/glucanases superfamily
MPSDPTLNSMNRTKSSVKSCIYRVCAVIGAAALVSSVHNASAQSIGFNFTTNGNWSGLGDNGEGDSLMSGELAGAPSFAQTNWNNLGRSGSTNAATLTDSAGNLVSLSLNWDAPSDDTTGTAAGLGTPDGKLMNAFIYSWGPGASSPVGTSVNNAPVNDKPLIYLSGLNAWWTGIPNAEGYGVVLYFTGWSYWATGEGWIESVTGSPFNSSMAEGSDLTPHLFGVDTGVFTGTYTPATSTSLANPTYYSDYMYLAGATNDAVLIRFQNPGGWGIGLSGFQLVPVFPAPPTVNAPKISPSSEVYALVPVTITETATGDPFHTNLWYQWYSDNATGGDVTHPILGATNAMLNVTPTNYDMTYNIQYVVVVTNIFGASTSAPVTLTVDPAVAPYLTQDTIPGPGNGLATVYAYAGGSVSFSAAFGGTPPTYLWESNSVSILNATNTTLTLDNLPLSASANYDLTATNRVGGIASTPAPLVVLEDLPAPDASTAYAYDVFTNNPVAYWRFSETLDNQGNSVQAYDYSGNNHDATYGTSAYDNQPGPQSPQFPGFESTNTGVTTYNSAANSYLTVPSLNLNTNTVTITAWVNPSGPQTANNGLFMWANNGDKAGFGFGGNVDPNTSMAELGYTWNSNSPSTTGFHSGLYPPANQWSFVALTIAPTNTTIYLYYIDVNTGATNLLKASQYSVNRNESFSGGTNWIGSDTSSSRTFGGTLDEVAVFGQTLSEGQVQDLFLKAIGATGVAPTVSDATIYPAASVYSGQNVRLNASISGTVPMSLRWQSSPDGSTWTDIPGATLSSLPVNPLTVGTVYYHLVAINSIGAATNAAAAVTFNALPGTPAGLWTVNYQVTNNVISYSTGGGVGYYSGRGMLGTGSYWNVLPATTGASGYIWQLTSVSDLLDDGATHSGVYCSVYGGSSPFGSGTAVQPDSSDIGNLLYQWVTSYNTNNSLQFHGLPDGTYNLCFYGCDGSFNDRGTTFVAHDAKNGAQVAGTVNASPILPLQQGVNFVVMSNVHVAGGTLNVDIKPTTPLPTHDPNTEADFNGVQLQLVSYDVPPPTVILNGSVVTNGVGGSSMTLSWPEGILQTSTNLLGPWNSIYSPSPVTLPVTTTSSAQFYRVKVE